MERRAFFTLAGVSAAALAAGGVLGSCGLDDVTTTEATDGETALGQTPVAFTSTTDVLIVGSGIAGLSAAMAPLESEYSVMIVEKLSLLGGESYEANGVMNVAGSNVQLDAGLTLTAQESWAVLKQSLEEAGAKDLTFAETLYLAAPDWVNCLQDSYGASFADPSTYATAGQNDSVLLPQNGIGDMDSIMVPLRDALSRNGVVFRTDYCAEAFIVNEASEVCGMRFSSSTTNTPLDVSARRVIVATGGFACNQTMVEAYTPSVLTAGCYTSASMGQGQQFCYNAGAQLVNMGSEMPLISDIPQVAAWGLFTPVLVVDALGRRFAAEDNVNAPAQACFTEERGYWWTIFDSQISSSGQSSSAASMSTKYASRLIGPFDDVATLAQEMGVAESTLEASFASYASMVQSGIDIEFERTLRLESLEAPYYAFKQFPVRFRSRGGAQTTDAGEMLDSSGVAIPNVYCCGSVSGSGGAGLASNGTFGMLVGQSVVASLGGEGDA